MPILFAAAGTPLASFIDGCLLGASVYIVARTGKGTLKKKH